jgi:RNA polymerase sigma-54 factor
VLGNLTPRGLLELAPERIAADLDVPEPEVEAVLSRLQDLAPGFAAASVEACLLSQLDALSDCTPDDQDLCRRVIKDHLHALALGQTTAIANSLGTSPARIAHLRELIRTRLRPPSGLPLGPDRPTPYAAPDVVVTLEGDDLRVEVVERHRFPLVVDGAFARGSLASHGPPDATGIAELAGRARAFIDRLEGRWRTLQKIAEATVLFQEAFIRGGPEDLQPLTRARIAAAEGLHESTVSRATKGRYVLLPDRSLVPFSRFFEASVAPKEALRRILARGDVRSDAQLTSALEEQGFCMARRTVAKYRRQLGFPALGAR